MFPWISIDDLLNFFSKRAPSIKNLDEETILIKENFVDLVKKVRSTINYYPDRSTLINDLKRKFGDSVSSILMYLAQAKERVQLLNP